MTTQDPALRAEDLLARMTLEEKAQQVTGVMSFGLLGPDGLLPDAATRLLGQGIGHVAPLGMFSHKPPVELARATNQVQRFLVEGTRLGIPAIFHVEALHGVVSPGLTAFPAPIGLAATWDPAGVEEMAAVLRRQARTIGHPFALSPVLDVARDARWGRVHETYGEDPYLVSAMGVAFVRGLQGDDPATGVIATAKHFVGYGAAEGGQNMAAASVGARELREVYARPFEAAIHEAGLAAVMNSYGTVDGVPAGASRAVLDDLLRDRLGFTGTVVSDYDTVRHLVERLGVAADAEQAGALALAAGLDVELPAAYGYGPVLADAVRAGRVPGEQLDRSVARVLRDKFALGLFDRPFVSEDPIEVRAAVAGGEDLARRLSRRSVTLLSNDGTLPLSRTARRIAVVGPHADDVTLAFGPYTYPGALALMLSRFRGEGRDIPGTEHHTVDVAPAALELMLTELGPLLDVPAEDFLREHYGVESLADAVRRLAPEAEVVAVTGCGVGADEPRDVAAAVTAAAGADVVVVALGGRAGWFTAGVTEGEGSDTADVDLPAHQQELVAAVAATGTPCVGVVWSGRPMALGGVVDHLRAIVLGYHAGPHGAGAVAEVLLGDAAPGGRLPISVPRHSGQVPVHAGQHRGSGWRRTAADMHVGYLDLPSQPLFALGHGLSYTTWDYAGLTVPSEVAVDGGTVTVSFTVTNTGSAAGTEVAQVYLSDRASGLTRPELELVGFARVELAPGEQAAVEVAVPTSQLGYVGLDDRVVLEPGPVEVHVGASAVDLRLHGSCALVGDLTDLEGRRSFLSTTRVRAARQPR